MSGPLRKIPRIMAKSARTSRMASSTLAGKAKNEDVVEEISIRSKELDDDHEQLLVRDGIVVGLQQPNGRFVDETGVQVPSSVVLSYPRTRRIIIESTSESADDYEPYIPTTLPGVADEVESYPCPLCPERVFLTSFGLERHSTEKHPEHLQEILDHIETISAEWRRREEELARRRDRMYSSRLRQENIARHAIEQVANGTLGHFGVATDSSEGVNTDAEGSGDPNEVVKEQRFKSCNLCGMLIDAESPTAMEHHLLLHKENDDLKHKLLARYGAEEVGRLMCRDCNLVFGDENSLLVHNDQMHIRRKKYICKWCGHVAHTMTELNLHKADVHAMPPFTAKSDRDRILRKGHHHGRGLIALGAHPRRGEIEDRHGPANTSNEDLAFRTTCEQCGLRLVRPSLLVRHMLRVHSKKAFSCEIEAPAASNYRIDVNCERITWTCCDNQYTSRREFLSHRMNNHFDKVSEGVDVSQYQSCQSAPHPDASMGGGSMDSGADVCMGNTEDSSIYLDQMESTSDNIMQVVVPDQIIGDGRDYYVVIDDSHMNGQGVNGEMNGAQQHLHMHSDPSFSSSSLLQEILIDEPNENGGELVEITAEQYEQLRLQYGDNLDMGVIYVSDDVSKNDLVDESGGRSTEVLRS